MRNICDTNIITVKEMSLWATTKKIKIWKLFLYDLYDKTLHINSILFFMYEYQYSIPVTLTWTSINAHIMFFSKTYS